jgi:hypothetical protein
MQLPSIFHPANLSYQSFGYYHLSEFEPLDRYDLEWAIFGTATYAKTPPTPFRQLKDFEEWVQLLGDLNHSHRDLLHWFARVEYSPGKRWHLHFMLGHERITNGRHQKMSVEDACTLLSSHWLHGNAVVEPYDKSEDGVAYLTTIGDRQLVGDTRMSWSLKKHLKKLLHSSRREEEIKEISRHHAHGRDPFTTELVIKLGRIKESGFIGFMDESPRWRQVA